MYRKISAWAPEQREKSLYLFTILLDVSTSLQQLYSDKPSEKDALTTIGVLFKEKQPETYTESAEVTLWTTYYCAVRDYFRSLKEPFLEEGKPFVEKYFNDRTDSYFLNLFENKKMRFSSQFKIGALIEETSFLYRSNKALENDINNIITQKYESYYEQHRIVAIIPPLR